MAMIHYQFEVIHPFYDGNGRTGRILNILYLVKTKKLAWPILYLSGYIHKNKNKYYELLQNTRLTQNFEPWILYILQGITDVSIKTNLLSFSSILIGFDEFVVVIYLLKLFIIIGSIPFCS